MLDFEDVLLATAGMIESEPSVAMHVRESYRHFVVDEYQDVSPAQQQLLDLWLGGRRDVCVVGDASQTIYSFAGATPEYLLGFERRYEEATVVRLERNYRSTPEIVGVANRLMRGRAGALQLEAVTEDDDADPRRRRMPRCRDAAPSAPATSTPPRRVAERSSASPSCSTTPTSSPRRRGVATRIRERVDAGVPPETIAVLMRVNSQTAILERALDEVGVGSRVRGAARFFDLPEVREAVHALRAAALTIAGEPLFKSVSDVLRSLGWTRAAARGARRGAGAVGVAQRDRTPRRRCARRHHVPRSSPTTCVRARRRSTSRRSSAVTLATLHSAKGLEWDEVHIVGLTEGMLPIAYAKGFDAIDEERRLLYVGITRARRRLTLSWPRVGRRASRRTGAVAVPPGARHPHSGCGACRRRRGGAARPFAAERQRGIRQRRSSRARAGRRRAATASAATSMRGARRVRSRPGARRAGRRSRARRGRHRGGEVEAAQARPAPGFDERADRAPVSSNTTARCGTSRRSHGRCRAGRIDPRGGDDGERGDGRRRPRRRHAVGRRRPARRRPRRSRARRGRR